MSKKLTLLSTALLVATAMMAQKDTINHNLDEVVVTANKIAQKQSTTGKVVTVISREQIEKSAGKSVAELLNEQAGITVTGALQPMGSVQTVNMRGGGAGRTLILLDGIPVSDPSDINNNFDLNFLSLNDVERIEICKGAQSTLYGSDAVAGVINIITQKTGTNTLLNGKATLMGGSMNTYKANTQLHGKLDKFTYSVRYAKALTDGFAAAYDSTGKAGFHKDGYNGDVANATLMYQANKQLSFKVFTMYSQYKTDIDPSAFTDATFNYAKSKSSTTGIGFNYKNDIVNLVGNYQYNQIKRIYDEGYSVGDSFFSLNQFDAINQYAELYANIKLMNNFSMLAGTDYRYGSFNSFYKSNSVFGPYNSNTRDTFVAQKSAYISFVFMDNNKKFTAEIGGRLNTSSRYKNNYTYTFNPAYNIDSNWRAFASVASGFKAPTMYQLSYNSKLLPETSVSYEGGLQFQNKVINTRLVYFNRISDNGIDFNNITFSYFNYVSQKVNGLEYEIKVKASNKVSLNANYTLLLANEKTQNRATNQDTITYNYLLRRPKHSFNTSLNVQAAKRIYISINGKYVSSRNDAGGYGVPDVELSSYFIFGAYAECTANKHTKLFVDGQNITNKKFFDVYGYNSIPLIFNGGITVNW